MATFNQDHANIQGNMYAADNIIINEQSIQAGRTALGGLLTQLQSGHFGEDVGNVVEQLREAQVADAEGNLDGLRAKLRRALELAAPIAGLAAAISQIILMF